MLDSAPKGITMTANVFRTLTENKVGLFELLSLEGRERGRKEEWFCFLESNRLAGSVVSCCMTK